MTKRKTVLDVAHVVRFLFDETVVSNEHHYDSTLCGACGFASAVLIKCLRKLGKEARFVEGSYYIDYHCWVETNEYSIIDVTATQFERQKWDKVLTCDRGEVTVFHKKKCYLELDELSFTKIEWKVLDEFVKAALDLLDGKEIFLDKLVLPGAYNIDLGTILPKVASHLSEVRK